MLRRAKASWKLLALLAPLALSAACGGDDVRVPTTLAPPSNTVISATVGAAVSNVPSVTIADQKGRALAGVWVKWTVTSGGGSVANDSAQTGATGVASSGGWTLGTTAGTQTLTASAAGLSTVTFSAQAAAGPVASLIQWSAVQTGVVNTVLTASPSVKAYDQFKNAVASVSIAFTVITGGGTITGATQTTGADGIATPTSWQLGSVAGDQKLLATATASGIRDTVVARALGGAPAQIAVLNGDAQIGVIGKRLCQSPSVIVTDTFGNGVAQVPVVFTPTSGSGTITGDTAFSDTTGEAAVGGWNLGGGATQALTATTALLPGKSVTISATTAPAPGFSICARFLGTGGTARQRLAVTRAIARWQSVIVGHVQTTHLNTTLYGTDPCRGSGVTIPIIDEDVEDLLLYVQLDSIDGPGQILAESAPCFIHLPAATPMMGFFRLDVADAQLMLTTGTLDNVVLHEIGHILGIGTLWNFGTTDSFGQPLVVYHALLNGAGSLDPFFAGAAARDQFALLGSPYTGTPVAVENCVGIPGCGAGTRDSHWRKSVFGNELMQGYVAPVMPLSKVTIGSLADLGYSVNLAAADAFSLLPSLRSADAMGGTSLGNDVVNGRLIGVEKGGAHHLLRSASGVRRR